MVFDPALSETSGPFLYKRAEHLERSQQIYILISNKSSTIKRSDQHPHQNTIMARRHGSRGRKVHFAEEANTGWRGHLPADSQDVQMADAQSYQSAPWGPRSNNNRHGPRNNNSRHQPYPPPNSSPPPERRYTQPGPPPRFSSPRWNQPAPGDATRGPRPNYRSRSNGYWQQGPQSQPQHAPTQAASQTQGFLPKPFSEPPQPISAQALPVQTPMPPPQPSPESASIALDYATVKEAYDCCSSLLGALTACGLQLENILAAHAASQAQVQAVPQMLPTEMDWRPTGTHYYRLE